jgi:hypothetical protein
VSERDGQVMFQVHSVSSVRAGERNYCGNDWQKDIGSILNQQDERGGLVMVRLDRRCEGSSFHG